jgi:uncharacterized protein DUF3768
MSTDLDGLHRARKIAELNDRFRTADPNGDPAGRSLGRTVITSGVNALGLASGLAILEKVMTFDSFTEDNDPYGEHDFGSFEHAGHRVFWKIDYFSRDLKHGSEDPADPSQTVRVLTIMLAEEY